MDWTQFTRKIRIKATTKQVYDAWMHREKLTTWFLKTAEHSEADINRIEIIQKDKVIWDWYNCEMPTEIEYIEANGKDHIVFTFGHGMEVKVNLQTEGNFTVMTLTQYNIPTDEESRMNFHVGCRQAWSTWMMNLKSWLEHGIVLHDKELGAREDLFTFVNT